MSSMFYGCSNLKKIESIFQNTSKVEYMYSMFYDCSSLKEIPNISKWNINNVKDMKGMFDGCINSINIPQMVQ